MNKLKKEFAYIGIVLLLLLLSLKIAFYKESILVLIRTSISLFWIFILPGFTIMYYWNDKLDFLERLVIGVALGAAIIGISSYYIGLIGISLRYHLVILPSLLILTGVFLLFVRKKYRKTD